MAKTLSAINNHPQLSLRLVVTGSHLDAARGKTIGDIRKAGFSTDLVIPWKDDGTPAGIADQTFAAARKMAAAHCNFKTDIALVLGDRVEAFAAAAAAQLLQLPLAHVHGGDRAQGQSDDTLRHAITKLAHIHITASQQSRNRVIAMGEEVNRVHCYGAPGLEGIASEATKTNQLTSAYPQATPGRYILVQYHPDSPDAPVQYVAAKTILGSLLSSCDLPVIALMPNQDAGAGGIVKALNEQTSPRLIKFAHINRADFLGLMRDCAVLVGNSSAGIIEAASFGTPVLDIGPRQNGREYGPNVIRIPASSRHIRSELRNLLKPHGMAQVRYPRRNLYARPGTSMKISRLLAKIDLTPRLFRKVITY